MKQELKEQKHSVIVIGGGPAGIQMGYFLKKENVDYVVLEKGDKVCQFFRKYPRHRNLISINKVNNEGEDILNLRYDWNSLLSDEMKPIFTDYSKEYFPKADLLAQYVEDFAEYHKINVTHNSPVEHISKKDDLFYIRVKDSDTVYVSKVVVSAAGFGGAYKPPIEGIELADDYADCPIEGDVYKNKKVFILGKGNSAFEFAKGILNYSDTTWLCSPCILREATETHYVGSVRAINNLSNEAYQLKSKNFIFNANIGKIEKSKEKPNMLEVTVDFHNNEPVKIFCDHVINATGFKMNQAIYDPEIRPKMRQCTKLPQIDHTFQSVNIKNLYFAGCLMHGCDYKRGTSGFVHGFRHNIKFLYRHILEKHFNKPLEFDKIKNVDDLCEYFIDQSTFSPELFLQIRTLVDVAIIRKGEISYYKGISMDYALSNDFKKEEGDIMILMYLNYGKFFQRSSKHPRPTKIEESYTAPYLHPYYFIYKYNNSDLTLKCKFEITEDLDNDFRNYPRDHRLKSELKQALEKVTGKEYIKEVYQTDFMIKEELIDAEILINTILGPYRKINISKNKNYNFIKYLPFEHVKDTLLFDESKFNVGYTFDCVNKLNREEFWSCRINHICEKEGMLKVEFWPHKGTEKSLLPINIEFCFPVDPMTEKKEVKVMVDHCSDLSSDLQKELKEFINNSKKIFE